MNDLTQQLHLLERDRDAAAVRLQALCAEPSPIHVEGEEYETWLDASTVKGALTLMLLRRIDGLNEAINALVFGVAA